jgi:hypothetical protein
MSKLEIIKIVKWSDTHWMPCGLSLYDKLWWRFMPGTVINVRWPNATPIKVGPGHREGWAGVGPPYEYIYTVDPNDLYRPWLEKYVGRQGWDWNWGMGGMDVTDNRLTIKIRRKYSEYATIAALNWS